MVKEYKQKLRQYEERWSTLEKGIQRMELDIHDAEGGLAILEQSQRVWPADVQAKLQELRRTAQAAVAGAPPPQLSDLKAFGKGVRKLAGDVQSRMDELQKARWGIKVEEGKSSSAGSLIPE